MSSSQPLTKKAKKTKNPSTLIPSLPDDLILSCFSRLSRLYYPTLSLVSKRFRTLISSPELYNTRSLLNRTEICLYVCLKSRVRNPNSRWFTLCHKQQSHQLVPISVKSSPQSHCAGVVALGSNIYTIGGPTKDGSPSSDVLVLDCRSNVWSKAPNMLVKRSSYATAMVFDGMIYVAGGCKDCDPTDWMEVFDPGTETWENVLCPLAVRFMNDKIYKSVIYQGRICMLGKEGLAYNPKEDKWESIPGLNYLDLGWGWLSCCVICNIFCCYSSELNRFKWYDYKRHDWMNIKGLKGLPKFDGYSRVKLANYGGKLIVLWSKYFRSRGYYKEIRIWCAVIVLERRSDGDNCYDGDDGDEIWGKVEWVDPVITLPDSFRYECALTVTV